MCSKYIGGMGTEADECQDHILSENGICASVSERRLAPKRQLISRKPQHRKVGFSQRQRRRGGLKPAKGIRDLREANRADFSGHEIWLLF